MQARQIWCDSLIAVLLLRVQCHMRIRNAWLVLLWGAKHDARLESLKMRCVAWYYRHQRDIMSYTMVYSRLSITVSDSLDRSQTLQERWKELWNSLGIVGLKESVAFSNRFGRA